MRYSNYRHGGIIRSRAAACLGLLTCVLMLTGCDSEDRGPTRDIVIWVRVSQTHPGDPPVPTQPYADITITQDGVRIAGATVTIDGVNAPPYPLDETQYGVAVDASAGDLVEVVATYDDIVIEGTCVIAGEVAPVSPVMTDGPQDATQDIPLTWTCSSFVPDKVRLAITGWDTVSGEDTFIFFDGAAVDAAIPADVMKGGLPVSYQLAAVNEASSLTVAAAPGSCRSRVSTLSVARSGSSSRRSRFLPLP